MAGGVVKMMMMMMIQVVVLVMACMVMVAPIREAYGAVTYQEVARDLLSCETYITLGGPVSASCCSGVRALNAAASTTPDRQTTCGCLKNLLASYPGIDLENANALPGKCGVSSPYKLSPSLDCSKVQ